MTYSSEAVGPECGEREEGTGPAPRARRLQGSSGTVSDIRQLESEMGLNTSSEVTGLVILCKSFDFSVLQSLHQ